MKVTQQKLNPDNAMPSTKIQGFLKQFPWIDKCIVGPVNKVYVDGLGPELLNYQVRTAWNGADGNDYERLYLLNEAGEFITCQTEVTKWIPRYFLCGPMIPIKRVWRFDGRIYSYYESNLWDTLKNLGEKADEVRYIVSYFEYTMAVILYKLPKGVLLRQWIENEIETEARNFDMAIDTLD